MENPSRVTVSGTAMSQPRASHGIIPWIDLRGPGRTRTPKAEISPRVFGAAG
jgi:hypothetical protein